jgi:hypothetical protein
MRTSITKEKVYKTILDLNNELGRPVCLADLRHSLGVIEKRESINGQRKADRITRAINKLFKERKISRTEEMIRLENYPASPYAGRRLITTNVYFYAPIDYAGRHVYFKWNDKEISQKFLSCDMVGEKGKLKKDMVLEVLEDSDRALTVREILERINEKYNAYEIKNERDFYNATTSITNGVLKRLRRRGVRGYKLDKWVWYLRDEQLERYKEYYVEKSEILNLVRDLVKNHRCIPINKVISELWITPDEAKHHLKKVAKYISVGIKIETSLKQAKITLDVPKFKRDSFVDWLGMVVPRSEIGYGYETFLVYLDSDWEEELKKQIRKSLKRIRIRNVIGSFYEKLVAKLFKLICTSKRLQNSELSKYMIPFVFRDKVSNVWLTLESGRRVEFDVLIRGTFNAFNALSQGRGFLDIVIPIESKYTMVKPEHVTAFDDKISRIFGERRNIIPIMIGLSWSKEALHLTKRLGIMTVYFSAIDNLIREMTGRKYRHEHEWKRVEDMLNQGRLSLEELRNKLDREEFKFLFEEYIEERIGCHLD